MNEQQPIKKEYPGTKNMIPLNTRPRSEHTAIARKGGQSKSKLKSEGQKLRHIKKRAKEGILKSADEAWLLKMVEDPKAMSYELLNWIKDIKNSADDDTDTKIKITSLFNQAHKTVHGDKHYNMNVNINTDIEELEKRLLL